MVRNQTSAGGGRRFTDEAGGIWSVIGPDLSIEGTLSGAGNLELKGQFEGAIDIDGQVWIRKGGRLKGSVTATDLVVEGEVEGTITATNMVDLREPSRVWADITAARIAAAEGSVFEGHIAMSGSEAGHGGVVTYREKRREP
jgi:cytoskeletal protein CcmA (bactofilin family)